MPDNRWGPGTPPVGGTVITSVSFRSFLNTGTLVALSGLVAGDEGSSLTIDAGNGNDAAGGGVYLSGGSGTYGGSINFNGGTGTLGSAGNITFSGGTGATIGGDISFYAGSGSSPGVVAFSFSEASPIQLNSDPTLSEISIRWNAGQNPNNWTIFTATRNIKITAVIARIDAVNGTAATMAPVYAASGTAYTSGTALTTNSVNANTGVNTNQTLTLVAGAALSSGQSIGLVTTGTWSLAAGTLTIHFAPV